MIARTPEELHRLFEKYSNDGDVDAVMSLYEEGAAIRGPEGVGPVRPLVARMLAMKPSVWMGPPRVIASGDLALMINEWHRSDTTADGEHVDKQWIAVVAARRQPDGTWRYVLDDPAILTVGEPAHVTV